MPDRTPHQEKIIKRYYEHRDDIMLNRLSEIVSELYLATSEGQLKRLWSRADAALKGLKVPDRRRERLLQQRDSENLAHLLRELQSSSNK